MEISRPFQILLALTAAFALLWFVALRPSNPATGSPTPAAPLHSSIPLGLGRAVDAAHGASKTSDATNAKLNAGLRQTAGPAPSGSGGATRAQTQRGRLVAAPQGLGGQLARGKVVLLLFYNPRSSDDRAVRDEVLAVNRHGGRVVARAVPAGDIYRYRALTVATPVLETPTLLVFDRAHRVQSLTGLLDQANVDQAAIDALGA